MALGVRRRRNLTVVPDAPPDDEAAIRALYAEHGAALYAYAQHSLRDRGKAEDVVQEALLRAWRQLDRLDPVGGVTPSLAVHGRPQPGDRRAAPGVGPPADGRPRLALAPSPSRRTTVDRVLEAWQVADALAQLRPEHREVIVETYYGGCSVNQAAEQARRCRRAR